MDFQNESGHQIDLIYSINDYININGNLSLAYKTDYKEDNSSIFQQFLDFNNFSILSKCSLAIWSIFITVGIWRSAENYKGNIIWIIATFLFLSYRIFSLRLIFFG